MFAGAAALLLPGAVFATLAGLLEAGRLVLMVRDGVRWFVGAAALVLAAVDTRVVTAVGGVARVLWRADRRPDAAHLWTFIVAAAPCTEQIRMF